jgi:hypothetical protein
MHDVFARCGVHEEKRRWRWRPRSCARDCMMERGSEVDVIEMVTDVNRRNLYTWPAKTMAFLWSNFSSENINAPNSSGFMAATKAILKLLMFTDVLCYDQAYV